MTTNSGQFKKGQHWRPHAAFRDRDWLLDNYAAARRSTGEIADEFEVTDAAIIFWLKRHGIDRRTVSQARAIKHWAMVGEDNPMWNRKGELNPHWKGGVTALRQAFYAGQEWKAACSAVWKRDNATCQRCGLYHPDDAGVPMHVHHIVSFADGDLRAETSNLVLVCQICHLWIHSKRNVNRDYIQ